MIFSTLTPTLVVENVLTAKYMNVTLISVSDKAGYDESVLCKRCSISENALYNSGNNLNFSDLRRVKVGDEKIRKRFENFVRVKNLKIRSSVHKLPFSVGTSKSLLNSTQLQELELVLKMFTAIKVTTNSVHFGHLKHLKLSGIYFSIDPSCDYLTLRLPVLKKLDISNCKWSNGKDVIVDASLLENISIQKDLNKLQGKSIKFNALYLKEFNYCGYGISLQINLSSCSFLPPASVKIILKQYDENNISERRCFAFQLFQHFHQLKCIKFEGCEFLTQSKEDVYPVSTLPVFANLSHLEFGLVTIEVIFGLLQKSPVLKTLDLALKPQSGLIGVRGR
ncbi:hypothetical protein QL285_039179 [Trifolium repens]|nr:hypothetical protein QL285_039179 [Trifolium repens]